MNHLFLTYLFAPCFQILDFILPKKLNYWAFAVHHIKADQFVENARAVFEEVKQDRSIKKILFTRDGTVDFGIEKEENFEIVNIKSLRGFSLMMQCGVVFVTHSLSMDYSLRYGKSQFTVLKINLHKRRVVNLWHGIPVKKLYALWNPEVRDRLDRVKYRRYERKYYTGLVTSSEVDSYAMATMFYPIKYENIWMTGLPRNDFLMKPEDELPGYIKKQLKTVKTVKGDKKLVLYAPTYRQTAAVVDAAYYQFSQKEMDELKNVLIKNNAILGIRLHYFRNYNNLFNIEKYIDNEFIFDLGHTVSPEIAPVIREADIVISDYSSVFIEALYIDKPLISFAYDYEHYRDKQDGVLYNYKMVFPGPILYNSNELASAIDKELCESSITKSDKYKMSQNFFFKNRDMNNSKRVVEKILNQS